MEGIDYVDREGKASMHRERKLQAEMNYITQRLGALRKKANGDATEKEEKREGSGKQSGRRNGVAQLAPLRVQWRVSDGRLSRHVGALVGGRQTQVSYR